MSSFTSLAPLNRGRRPKQTTACLSTRDRIRLEPVVRGKSTKTSPANMRAATLKCAAELILETGQRSVDIQALAKRAKIPRSSIYGQFGATGDVKHGIFVEILNEFLGEAATRIHHALATMDPRSSSPVEQLAAIFRATLATFRSNPLFGKVVLAQLNLRSSSEAGIAFRIFDEVDKLIAAAKKDGQLGAGAERLQNWKIRQVLFVVAHGLLRAMYLGEGTAGNGKSPKESAEEFTEVDVELEVLRVLNLYCSQDAREKIESTMLALLNVKK